MRVAEFNCMGFPMPVQTVTMPFLSITQRMKIRMKSFFSTVDRMLKVLTRK